HNDVALEFAADQLAAAHLGHVAKWAVELEPGEPAPDCIDFGELVVSPVLAEDSHVERFEFDAAILLALNMFGRQDETARADLQLDGSVLDGFIIPEREEKLLVGVVGAYGQRFRRATSLHAPEFLRQGRQAVDAAEAEDIGVDEVSREEH